ncbi:probable assembly chaperone of rpl4 [Lates japonicus]|uniref:Probable assembly chaperone of rpl4 n=1 Tax=Lates japonicus TaxID=270547 RepID=A0AAD3N1Z9_LATJO|nr:probable assembly chaperone of rpl4 [Lates japonicus]
MASYLFSTERNQEGREYLLKSVGLWLPAQKQSAASSSTEEGMQSEIPPYESRITTAKLLVESEEYEMAVDVLEGLLEEDDEVVQVWYLSGWVCYLQLEKAKEQQQREGREVTEEETEEWKALKEAARSYLTNAKKLYSRLRCDDQPMLEHVEQLLGELGGEVEGEEGDPALDEDYEPCSDEEEEEDAEKPMEHDPPFIVPSRVHVAHLQCFVINDSRDECKQCADSVMSLGDCAKFKSITEPTTSSNP